MTYKQSAGVLMLLGALVIGCEIVDEEAGADGGSGLPRFDPEKAVQIPNSDGPGGFVSNPDNSRDTLKIVYPSQYSGQIEEVMAFSSNVLFDTLYRETPDEGGDRQRYYGTKNIGEYPDGLIVQATLEGTNVPPIWFELPNPQQRYD